MKVLIAVDSTDRSLELLEATMSIPFKKALFSVVSVAEEVTYDQDEVGAVLVKKLDEYNSDAMRRTKATLTKAKDFFDRQDIEAEYLALRGDPVETILNYSEANDTDLIILGDNERNKVVTVLLGSVSKEILSHSHCSVLIHKYGQLEDKLKIAVGYDGSPSAHKIVDFCSNLASKSIEFVKLFSYCEFPSKLTDFYEFPKAGDYPDYDKSFDRKLAAGKSSMELALPNTKIEQKAVYSIDNIADALLLEAEECDANLVVVGKKGKNLLNRVLLGSVSNKLANKCEKMILVVK